jgi:hypothetical protein
MRRRDFQIKLLSGLPLGMYLFMYLYYVISCTFGFIVDDFFMILGR